MLKDWQENICKNVWVFAADLVFYDGLLIFQDIF